MIFHVVIKDWPPFRFETLLEDVYAHMMLMILIESIRAGCYCATHHDCSKPCLYDMKSRGGVLQCFMEP